MVTTIKVPQYGISKSSGSYAGKQKIDTTIPPKAKPVFNKVSVNGVIIPEANILHEAQNHPAKTPGEALLQAARALVIRELLGQEALKKGLISNNNISDSTLLDTAITALLDMEVDTPKATTEDCLRLYENEPSRFLSDTIWEVRHILILADPKDSHAYHEAELEAEKILAILQKRPDDFAKIAKEFSACPSAKEGGNLGQITRGSTVPEFENALKRAKEAGLLSTPVASRYGYHLIDISRIIPGELLPFDMVKDRIAAWLEASSWSKAIQQYIVILAGKSHITGIEVLPKDGSLVQ